jgi:hypothetical protein
MTELELIDKVLEDCICSRKDICREFVKSAIRYTRENLNLLGDSKFVRVAFECGKWKRISIKLIKEVDGSYDSAGVHA